MLRLPPASCSRAAAAGAGRCAGEGLPDTVKAPLMWTASLGLLEMTCTEAALSGWPEIAQNYRGIPVCLNTTVASQPTLLQALYI